MSQHPKFELAVPVTASDHLLGVPSAAVTVVEYGDFECPNCKQAAPAVKILFARFAGRIRLVFRHYPLKEVHPHALGAAQAAEAAAGQGKFWPMHDLLFANQPHFKTQQLRGYALKLELDMERYDAEIADDVYLQRVREHEESAMGSGVRATPTFFINARLHDVSYGIHALADGIEAALR